MNVYYILECVLGSRNIVLNKIEIYIFMKFILYKWEIENKKLMNIIFSILDGDKNYGEK